LEYVVILRYAAPSHRRLASFARPLFWGLRRSGPCSAFRPKQNFRSSFDEVGGFGVFSRSLAPRGALWPASPPPSSSPSSSSPSPSSSAHDTTNASVNAVMWPRDARAGRGEAFLKSHTVATKRYNHTQHRVPPCGVMQQQSATSHQPGSGAVRA
jgi:hypothetical protein